MFQKSVHKQRTWTTIDSRSQLDKLFKKLANKLTQPLTIELQDQQCIEQIEILLNDLLEKFQIHYVERLSTEDVEQIQEQTRILRQEAKTTSS